MDMPELLDTAKRKKGSLGNVAKELGVQLPRLSEWRSGRVRPTANAVAHMAEIAELPVLETVASVMAKLHPEVEGVWLRALGQLLKIKTFAGEQLSLAFDRVHSQTDPLRWREQRQVERRIRPRD